MDLYFLPDLVLECLKNVDLSKVYEIRLRENFSVSVVYDNKRYLLGKKGLCEYENLSVKCEKEMIEYVINNLTEYSVYAFNDKLKKGFLTSKNGIRIGVAGECVYDKELITIKNPTSLNIRIPHEIKGCADELFTFLTDNNGNVFSALIISPPFCGKTTMLKDLARTLNKYYKKSILIIDERGEFASVQGANIDTIKYCDKSYAFNYGIRSLSPEIVITDELQGKNDWNIVADAVNSGVKIIASCHADNLLELKNKEFFVKGLFERYFVISKNNRMGIINGVFDREFNKI